MLVYSDGKLASALPNTELWFLLMILKACKCMLHEMLKCCFFVEGRIKTCTVLLNNSDSHFLSLHIVWCATSSFLYQCLGEVCQALMFIAMEISCNE